MEQLSLSSTGLSLSSEAREPQPPSPQAVAAEPELHRQRGRRSEACALPLAGSPVTATRGEPVLLQRPSTAKR